jgi:hypothetical protein
MGTAIGTSQVEMVRRCCRIIINAPYGQDQSIVQEYEDIAVSDGEMIATKQAAVYPYSVPEMLGITVNVGGKQVTGADVLAFFLYFNDHREECLGITSE